MPPGGTPTPSSDRTSQLVPRRPWAGGWIDPAGISRRSQAAAVVWLVSWTWCSAGRRRSRSRPPERLTGAGNTPTKPWSRLPCQCEGGRRGRRIRRPGGDPRGRRGVGSDHRAHRAVRCLQRSHPCSSRPQRHRSPTARAVLPRRPGPGARHRSAPPGRDRNPRGGLGRPCVLATWLWPEEHAASADDTLSGIDERRAGECARTDRRPRDDPIEGQHRADREHGHARPRGMRGLHSAAVA
jgi:hypothetical protein